MKRTILSLGLVLGAFAVVLAQVGIKTTDPLATLDINGDLRVTNVNVGTDKAALDSILVVNGNGIVNRVSSDQVYTAYSKSAAKGVISGSINLLSAGVLTWNKIEFDEIQFDTKSEYDPIDHEFEITRTGVYKIYFQYKYEQSGIIVSLVPNIAIRKNGSSIATNSPVLAVDNYLVSKTMVALEAGDTITFYYGALLSLGFGGSVIISSDVEDTFFTVEQIY